MRSHPPLENYRRHRSGHFREPILEFIQGTLFIALFAELLHQVTLVERRRIFPQPFTQTALRQSTRHSLLRDRQPSPATSRGATSSSSSHRKKPPLLYVDGLVRCCSRFRRLPLSRAAGRPNGLSR